MVSACSSKILVHATHCRLSEVPEASQIRYANVFVLWFACAKRHVLVRFTQYETSRYIPTSGMSYTITATVQWDFLIRLLISVHLIHWDTTLAHVFSGLEGLICWVSGQTDRLFDLVVILYGSHASHVCLEMWLSYIHCMVISNMHTTETSRTSCIDVRYRPGMWWFAHLF